MAILFVICAFKHISQIKVKWISKLQVFKLENVLLVNLATFYYAIYPQYTFSVVWKQKVPNLLVKLVYRAVVSLHFLQVKLVFRAVVSFHFIHPLTTYQHCLNTKNALMGSTYMGNKIQRKNVLSSINILICSVKDSTLVKRNCKFKYENARTDRLHLFVRNIVIMNCFFCCNLQ